MNTYDTLSNIESMARYAAKTEIMRSAEMGMESMDIHALRNLVLGMYERALEGKETWHLCLLCSDVCELRCLSCPQPYRST